MYIVKLIFLCYFRIVKASNVFGIRDNMSRALRALERTQAAAKHPRHGAAIARKTDPPSSRNPSCHFLGNPHMTDGSSCNHAATTAFVLFCHKSPRSRLRFPFLGPVGLFGFKSFVFRKFSPHVGDFAQGTVGVNEVHSNVWA